MFDNRSRLPASSDRNIPILEQEQSLASINDSLSSLTHRINEIEAAITRKMDRSECLAIVDKKVSMGHLKHWLQQLESRMKEEHRQEEERSLKMQQIAIEKINDLGERLRSINTATQGRASRSRNPGKNKQRIVKPQQLLLQSNETMFSLLIQEVSKLQERDHELERSLEARNKKMISLNNEVCKKIEKLEHQIEDKLRFRLAGEQTEPKYLANSWSQIDPNTHPTLHKPSQMEASAFQSIRLDLISKSIEALQKEMLSKLNIKDVLPLVRQNTHNFAESIQQVKEYVEESMESTRKILSSQTQINHELSLGLKVGWWHSFAQENEIAIINKEVINLVPQILEYPASKVCPPNYINISHQGLYLVKIYSILQTNGFLSDQSGESDPLQDEFEVMIGTQVHVIPNQSILRLQKNSQIRIIVRRHSEIVFCIQKI